MESAKRTFFLVTPKELIRLRPPGVPVGVVGVEFVVKVGEGSGESVIGDVGGDECVLVGSICDIS